MAETVNLPAPDWLTRHGGSVRPALNGHGWFVDFAGGPQYQLTLVPVGGVHGCKVIQAVNGRPVPFDGMYGTPEEALRGGLEVIRKALGW
jgi:hypothetical protein